MLRGLKTITLGTTAISARSFKGRGLIHLARGAATGNLALVIEHSDNGTSGWVNSGAITFPAGTDLTGASGAVEVDMDKFKPFIRRGTGTVGDVAVVVAQVDGY
jgi:hypothetical protein